MGVPAPVCAPCVLPERDGTLVNSTMINATEDENVQKTKKEFIVVGVGVPAPVRAPCVLPARHHQWNDGQQHDDQCAHCCLRALLPELRASFWSPRRRRVLRCRGLLRPQGRVQRRTVEQIVDPVPVVPVLQMVVPQMVEQLVDFLTPLDFPIPEQVIEVPKIVCPPRAARTLWCAADGGTAGGSGSAYDRVSY